MISEKYDSILFDLDGTLWDSSLVISDSWEYSIKTHFPDLEIPDMKTIKGAMGNNRDGMIRYYTPMYGDLAESLVDFCLDEEVGYVASHGGALLYDGVDEVIKALSKDRKLFVVSNCQIGYIDAFYSFSKFGECFTSDICAGQTGNDKGENALEIIRKYNLKSPLFVGDTRGDEKAARHANTDFAFASYGFGEAQSPDYILKSIKDLI